MCAVSAVYIILSLSMMLSLARWGCLTTLTITYINTTLTPGNNGLLDSRLLAIGNLLAQTCRVAQFPALIYGVWKFRQILTSKTTRNVFTDKTKKFFRCDKCCDKKHNACTVHTFILLGVLILYLTITWSPPILLSMWFHEFALWHDDDENQQNASIGYTVLAWFHHISDLSTRLVMGIMTRIVMVAWSTEREDLNRIEKSENEEGFKFTNIVKSYKQTGRMVSGLQDIFQEWFVMAWVVYFIGVTGNTTLVLKALFTGQFSSASHRSWFYFAHLVNDFAAFLLPYICGGLMNYYHEKYRETLEDVQEKILSQSVHVSVQIQQRANLVPVNQRYKFVPAFFCLNIPLESAGYSFALILTSFAFVLSFVTAFTSV